MVIFSLKTKVVVLFLVDAWVCGLRFQIVFQSAIRSVDRVMYVSKHRQGRNSISFISLVLLIEFSLRNVSQTLPGLFILFEFEKRNCLLLKLFVIFFVIFSVFFYYDLMLLLPLAFDLLRVVKGTEWFYWLICIYQASAVQIKLEDMETFFALCLKHFSPYWVLNF